MDKIKVSVVLLVYNHEEYIEKAIESVLMQKVNFKYELLIGEDCSTDNSLDIIRKYEKYEQVKIFAREKNMNNEKVRNGLDLLLRTQGEYVINLEGDDYWTDSNKLQKQVDFLDNNPEYIACAHRFKVIDRQGNAYHDEDFEIQFFQDNPYDKKVFENSKMISHLNSIMYRNIHNNNSFDLSLYTDYRTLGGDYIINAYLVLNGKIYCLPDEMSVYRKVIDKDSSSYSAQMEKCNTRDKLYEDICNLEKELNSKYEVNMEHKKKITFASAIFKWNREKTRENFRVVMRIIKLSKKPLKYIYWMIYLLVVRCVYNQTGRRQLRVKF